MRRYYTSIHGRARTDLQSTRHKEKNTLVHTPNTQVHTANTQMYTRMHTNTQTHTLHLRKSRLATPVATLHRSLLPSTINYQRSAYSQMFNHSMVTHYHLIVILIVNKINLRRQSYSSADGRGQESVDELKMQNSYFRQR